MTESFETSLWVNDTAVDLSAFVEEFLARTVVGAVSSLKGAEDMRNLELYVEEGYVRVIVNGKEIELTPFPNDAIANTVTGLVSTLKDVDKAEKVKITVKVL